MSRLGFDLSQSAPDNKDLVFRVVETMIDFFSGPEPRVFAHRGASARAPENTLESFRLARNAGAPYLELDVHLTGDGRLVVIHDSSVARTTGKRGRVENMKLEAIRKLDAGCRFTPDRGRTFPYRGRGLVVPTLDEVLESFPDARLTIEVKRSREGIVEAVVDTIRRFAALDRVIVASHEDALVRRVRAVEPRLLTSFGKREVRQFLSGVRRRDLDGYRPPGRALQVPEYFGLRRVVSPSFIETAHGLGLEVHVWTVNEPIHIQRLLDWGVDGIMTDDPAKAFATVEALNGNARASVVTGDAVGSP